MFSTAVLRAPRLFRQDPHLHPCQQTSALRPFTREVDMCGVALADFRSPLKLEEFPDMPAPFLPRLWGLVVPGLSSRPPQSFGNCAMPICRLNNSLAQLKNNVYYQAIYVTHSHMLGNGSHPLKPFCQMPAHSASWQALSQARRACW